MASRSRGRRKIGEILVGAGVVSQDQVDAAATTAKGSGKRLGECLVEAGNCSDVDIAKALAEQLEGKNLGKMLVQVSEDPLK